MSKDSAGKWLCDARVRMARNIPDPRDPTQNLTIKDLGSGEKSIHLVMLKSHHLLTDYSSYFFFDFHL